MILELYDTVEDIEVSFSENKDKDFYFKSELKNLTFDFSIVKFQKINDYLEKVVERERFLNQNFDNKCSILSKIKISDATSERLEIHLKLIDKNLDYRTFYFNLGSNWIGGGRLFVRTLCQQ